MAWHISFFLKYLRSLEEFRKIPMSKSLLNFLVQISKALVNSKIKFLIQKSFFFISARLPLPAHSAFGPAGPAGPSPPAGRSQLCKKYVFFFDSCLPFSAPSLYPPADTWAPLVGFVFSTAPVDPGRVSTALSLPAPPAACLGCRRAITTPHHSSI
jgi:hypothetical protein